MNLHMPRPRWIKKICPIGVLAIFFFGWVSAGSGQAQEEEVLKRGEYLYQRYCATCHGERGKGDGIMAEQLQIIRPTDLTELKIKHHGQFPFWRTYRIIDGREAITGHGRRDMPIWGDWFRIIEGQDEDTVRGRIWQLIFYLESIQENERP